MTTNAQDTDRRHLRLVKRDDLDELVAELVRERHGDQRDLERERFTSLTTERRAA